jgi:hypothetical protein
VAAVATLGSALAAGCNTTFKSKALKGDNIFTSTAAVSNGGFAVEKGDYIYFINGAENSTATNDYGDVVKGAIMRISKTDLINHNYSSVDTVVPQIAYSGSYCGIYIYGDYIYYTTPSTEKNGDGEVLNSNLAFNRTKLDGTGTSKTSLMQFATNSVEYRYVEVGSDVYILYVATSEDLYGTSYTNLHSYNINKDVDTLLAYNVDTVTFDDNDPTNPRVYYTMNVTDFATDTSYSSYYNQIYTVTADVTTPNEYDFSDVEDYDADDDPLYINCGTLVYDGIGQVQVQAGGTTTFNGANSANVATVPYTYSISSYNNGTLYYERTGSDDTAKLFAEKDSVLTASSHDANANVDDETAIIRDASSASDYTYMYDDNGNLEWVLISDTAGIVKARVVDGKISQDTGKEYENRFYITKTGQATVLFIDNGFIYYSLTGGNGYTFYRVSIEGTYDDYNCLDLTDTTDNYKEVRILDLDSKSGWYMPEMFCGQILFATQTTNMTSYDYIMACDISKNNGTEIMTNAEIKALNEQYDDISETIADIDSTIYENLPDTLTYIFYMGEKDYMSELIQAYVDIESRSEEYIFSKESVALYENFYAATGDFAKFATTKKVNGEDVFSNRRDYYYSVVGQMTDDDKENYQSLLETSYFKSYPEEDDTSWYDGLSTGAKVGFIIGMCAAGLLVIAAIALVVILIINHRKKKMPVYKKKRIKVDTTDDKNIDVYADENAKVENAEETSPTENNSDTNE